MNHLRRLVTTTLALALLAMATVVGTATSASAADTSPLYCNRQNMDDGLTSYTYLYNLYGKNYYRYDVRNAGISGQTSCIEGPEYLASGELAAEAGKCVAAGAVIAVGTVILRNGRLLTAKDILVPGGIACIVRFIG